MSYSRFIATCLGGALAFSIAAIAVAQQSARIWMVECRTNDCWGGPSPQDSMTPTVALIQRKARNLNNLLPPDIRIEVMIVGGYDFNHQYAPGRPHLITVGVNALAELHNNWVESFHHGGENAEEAFGAIVEWTFYHEVGHALLDHAAHKQPHLRNSDFNHERLADRFATVAMMFANTDAARRATFASQGIYAMRLARSQQSAASPGVRDAFERRAAAGVRITRRRGVDGILGAHSPTGYRAWGVRCYVWGSGLGPNPGLHQGTHEGKPATFQCNPHDFNNALWELHQYAPFLPKVELNRVTRYDPQQRRLWYVQ